VVLDPAQQATPTRGVLASYKTPTTSDTTVAVESAIREVIARAKIDSAAISSITIETTAFLNAVIERDHTRLTRVAVLRLSKSFLRDVRPFGDWPVHLAEAIRGYVGM
jgi:N-methylhydantoinase A/oxoprolinase/acetone carboxylase beta subunit